jgi:SET domain-containing protein
VTVQSSSLYFRRIPAVRATSAARSCRLSSLQQLLPADKDAVTFLFLQGAAMSTRKTVDARNLFVVRKTRTGLGLFTRRSFAKDDFVIEYTGVLLPNDVADRKGGRYLFRVNSRWTIDGFGRENLSRYINHSCAPNCIAYTRGKKIRIYACRDIAPGEELSYDYGKEYFDAYIKPKGCACPACRKLAAP